MTLNKHLLGLLAVTLFSSLMFTGCANNDFSVKPGSQDTSGLPAPSAQHWNS